MVRTLALACLVLAGASAARAGSWWDGEWTLRKQVIVDTSGTGAAITDPLGATPVLLRLHDGDFQFAAAKPDGTDIRFIAADDKTPLAYHIEKFDPVLNEAFVWVNIPGLKPGAKTAIWLYYGNSGNKAVKVESAKDTYDADTVLVYHFNEHGQPCFDFTGQGNNAQGPGIAADGSMIGTGLRLDGKSSVNIPGSASLAWQDGSAFTWSAWVKFGQPQSQAVLFSRRDDSNVFVIGADNEVPFVSVAGSGGSARTPKGPPVGFNSWHHVSVVANGPHIDLYVDGDPYASLNAGLPPLSSAMVLGGDGSPLGGGTGFVGEMDELEISRIARSAGYLKFLALEQGADSSSKVVVLGADEQPTSWLSFLKKGYVGVIIGSLTPDGWAVIGILGVMELISVLVMVSKAVYLTRVGKGNDVFLKEWRSMGTKFGALDDPKEPAATADAKAPVKSSAPRNPALKHSPLFHIYHLGMDEVRGRLAADKETGSSKGISARSIEAIRATLDGGLVREGQRLSSSMVLLTIAISGGPFLGLLGTVVGVMITFAAVAQAGDVNVNAIAPGIAAALAATVAGLGVAIPALFGYNYLLTRIKGMTSDMHVFVDEFVTKLAEHYQDGAE